MIDRPLSVARLPVPASPGRALLLGLVRRGPSTRASGRLLLVGAVVLAVLASAAARAVPFERAGPEAVHGGGAGETVPGRPPGLLVDGRLLVRAGGEYRFHEALVHPAMAGPHRRVLILGGGDGLALREVLRYADTASVTVVELDSGLVRVARTDPGLAALNRHAFIDRRVHAVMADTFEWLRSAGASGSYDVVVCDLPDPGMPGGARLYSEEFYGLAAAVLAPGGRLAVPVGLPGADPRQFWTVDATVRAAGLRTADYWMGSHSSRGFVLASRTAPGLRLAPDAPRLASLTPRVLRAAGRAADAARIRGMRPSTLVHPQYPD